MNKIAMYLNQHVVGNVFSHPRVLDAYESDRSILKIRPKVVAVPATVHDVRKLVRFSNQLAAKKFELPITVVGSQTDTTGAAIGKGMIISTEGLDRIQEIDPRQKLVRVQAGVKLGELNSALALHGLTVPLEADPKATIGGLISNYAMGGSSVKYGTIFHFIEQAEIVLSSGDYIQTERLSERGLSRKKGIAGFEGEIYRKLDNLLDDNAEKLGKLVDEKNFGLAGYEMITRVRGKKGFDILPLFFAAQGTLGVITEVIMNCELLTPAPTYLVATFKSGEAMVEFAEKAAKCEPRTIDIIDTRILAETAGYGKIVKMFSRGVPENGYLMIVSFDDEKARRRRKKISRLSGEARCVVSNEENYTDFIGLNSLLVSYLNDAARGERVPFVDEVGIPEGRITDYLGELKALEEKHGVAIPVYGSCLTRHFTVRPIVELGTVLGRQFVLAFLRDYNKMLGEIGGTLAGGTPEGRVKAIATTPMLDPALAKIYGEVKEIFDPRGVLNPGVKGEVSLQATVRQLRTSYNEGIIK